MPTPSDTRSRQLSYANPVLYNGSLYPSTEDTIEQNGNVHTGRIFADSNSQYFTINSQGRAVPATVQNILPEVTVLPSRQDMLADAFNGYLTMSNDNTRVLNSPHREYNPHLTSRTIRGAKEHNLWEQQHPNASSWSYAAAAAPFAVAAAPAAISAGQTLAGTTLGQTAINGIGRLMVTPIAEAVNTGLGLNAVTHGVYDATQGRFTPSTMLELSGLYPLSKTLTRLSNKGKRGIQFDNIKSKVENVLNNSLLNYPLKNEVEIPSYIKAKAAERYKSFINSSDYFDRLRSAGLENHWEYMKDLTNRRLNNVNYFPSKVKTEIKNDPEITGMSSVEPSSSYYGITLKEDLPYKEIYPTLYHEVAHWATGNAGINDMVNSVKYPFKYDDNVRRIGDVMRYNESIAPFREWENVLDGIKEMPIDKIMKIQERYDYLTQPQEIRARLYNIYQQAKDNNISLDSFVDKYTKNSRITSDAPMNLQQLGEIFTIDNLKKRLNKFVTLAAPVGIGTMSKNNSSTNP